MSYSIYIGNTKMRPVEDNEYTTDYTRIMNGSLQYFEPIIEEIRRPDAPTFPNDEMTGNSNGRHPAYSAWGEFCRDTGLYGLFFDDFDGLMREHPGHAQLTREHWVIIHTALDTWRSSHPDATPGFEKFSWEREEPDVGYDAILARRVWLEWWVRWSLENCEHAGIYNY